MDEYESVERLPWLGRILEVLVVVRIALQIPIHSMSQSYHTVATGMNFTGAGALPIY